MSTSTALDVCNNNLDILGKHAGAAAPAMAGLAASAGPLTSKLTRLAASIVSASAALKGMDIADEYTNTATRLSLINDGLQTNLELQEAIFAAAENARGSYTDMASAVSKLGLNAADAFSSTGEIVAFTELLQKSFKISGASNTEQSAAMLQLTQAMGSGKLQGDEFRSIMENAPMLADAIAKYIGISKGELKGLASEGVITSDIIKNAVFASGDDIVDKFEAMPVTFHDVWTKIKNHALQSFAPIIEKVTDILNSDGFTSFIDNICSGINTIVTIISSVVAFISENWYSVIEPILIAVGTVYLAPIIAKLWAMIPPLIAQAAAWLAAYWPLLLVIGIIAVAIIAARQFGLTWEDVCGFIGGVIGMLITPFYNTFAYIWNVVADFVNFFANVFNNPIASIKILFLSLAENVINIVKTMVQGIEDLINLIPFVEIDITSGIESLSNSISDKITDIKAEAEWEEVIEKKDFLDLSEGAAIGSSIGRSIGQKLDDGLFDFGSKLKEMEDGFKFNTDDFASEPIPVSGLDGGAVEVNIADEDLQYLRDIAERDYIAKVSANTLAPNVQISFGDVHETADIEQLVRRIEEIMEDELAVSAEGVYSQ